MRLAIVALPLLAYIAGPARSPSDPPRARVAERVAPNDNRHAAGRLADGVLSLRLVARAGEWRPDGDSGAARPVEAFAEEGGGLQTPGPMIRVPVGTRIDVTITNRLVKPMWVFGLGAKRGWLADSALVAPNASRRLGFVASEAGTFYYTARTDTFNIPNRLTEDTQLNGVIVVDAPGARPVGERIFVITGWATLDSTSKSGLGPHPVLAFNGRSWPHTERLQLVQGDSVHWRFVNASGLDHPLHIHGFFFRVDSKGDGVRDTVYARGEGRMGVTEYLVPGQTTALSWYPDRSGNWIFHCHFADHIAPDEAFEADRSDMSPHRMAQNHMAGLVIGMHVAPRGAVVQAGEATRDFRLIVRSRAKQYGDYVGYSFVLGGTPEERDTTAMPIPGPLLELARGERVAFTIVNRSHDEAAVHWHGIELESYADGVPNWSGWEKKVLPMIPPGDSLTVHYTPPRAGTFMYHSHSNEFQQISSGLYGALIVLEPGQRRDTTLDKVLLFSDNGPTIKVVDPTTFPYPLLNGKLAPPPIALLPDTSTRLRLINIRGIVPIEVTLKDGDSTSTWRIVAKDGFPTTVAQSAPRPSRIVLGAGETYDVVVRPRAGEQLSLTYGLPGAPPPIAKSVTVLMPVIVARR